MQKQTPREAKTRQRTDTRIERLARKPRPDRRWVRPPSLAGRPPRLSRVVKW